MGSIINIYKDYVASITPEQFELHCMETLKAYAEEEQLKDFVITHNDKLKTDDGEYQIDVYAEFIALSVKFKVVAECKRYSTPVEREKIAVLADKVRSLGAHKGILISTSGFQSGAIEYAEKHGIALLQIFNKAVVHIQNSISKEYLDIQREIFRRSPDYYTYEWYSSDYPFKRQIFPTKKSQQELIQKMIQDFKIKEQPND